VAVSAAERVRATIHERGRRIVADEAARQLGRDEMCGLRGLADDVEHRFAVFDAASGCERMSENGLLAGVVDCRIEHKLSGRAIERPSGEGARNLLNVLLRVA